MSHISELKVQVKSVGDVNLVMQKLQSLGYKVSQYATITDYYGNKYNYDDVVLYIYMDKTRRYIGLKNDGTVVGDFWGLTQSEIQSLQNAIITSVISAELEQSGMPVEIRESEENGVKQYELLAYDNSSW